MKKTFKNFLSLLAMFAFLFTLGSEAMAAKKSKTLKNTQKKGFVRCGVSQGLPGFSNISLLVSDIFVLVSDICLLASSNDFFAS